MTCINGQVVTPSKPTLVLETNGVLNGSQVLLNLKQAGILTITDDGSGGITLNVPAPAPTLVLKTNGVLNGSQTLLNLQQAGIVTLTDNGAGQVTISVPAPVYPVTSVFGRTGAVIALAGDYAAFYPPIGRLINTTAPLTGGGDLSADRTLSVALATVGAVGVVKPDGTTITIDGTGKLSAAGVSGSGLFSQILSATPTKASSGLTNTIGGTGTASSNIAIGVSLIGDHSFLLSTSVPSTPYTITVLLLCETSGTIVPCLGWCDGTKLQFIYQSSATAWNVQNNSNFSTFVSTVASGSMGCPFGQQFAWLRIKDDGVNVFYYTSPDGCTWTQRYTVAKSAGYLGATGYKFIAVGQSGTSFLVNVLSYTQS